MTSKQTGIIKSIRIEGVDMTDSTQTKDLYSLFRFIITQQQSGRLDPTRASEEWRQVFADYEANVIGCVMAEVIFRLTRDGSL